MLVIWVVFYWLLPLVHGFTVFCFYVFTNISIINVNVFNSTITYNIYFCIKIYYILSIAILSLAAIRTSASTFCFFAAVFFATIRSFTSARRVSYSGAVYLLSTAHSSCSGTSHCHLYIYLWNIFYFYYIV